MTTSTVTSTTSTTASWPTPNAMPGTGGFDASIPSDTATNYNGTGYIDKLKDGLAAITSSQSPEVIQGVLAYIINLENDPATASQTTSFLNQNVNMTSLIQTATLQGMESAFFMGYTDAAGTTASGETGASNYLQDMISALGPSVTAEEQTSSGTSYASMMTEALTGLSAMLPQFAADHTDSSGNLIWTYGGVTYTWDSTPSNNESIADSIADPTSDNFYIASLITGLDSSGAENSLYSDLANNFSSMEANWRVSSLNEMIASFKAQGLDVIDAIMMWITVAYDNQYQSQESALANTTNSETLQTNSYATPLAQDVQEFGQTSFNSTSAENFVDTLLNWNNYVSTNPNSSSIASSLETNTIEPVLNAQITSSDTLGSYLTNISNGVSGYSYDGLATALNALVPADPTAPTVGSDGTETGGSTTASTSPAYLAITNAIEAGGDLVTQTSKQTSTDLTEITNLDNALLQLGSSAVNPQGSGPMAFQQAIVNNQRSYG